MDSVVGRDNEEREEEEAEEEGEFEGHGKGNEDMPFRGCTL